VPIIRQMPMFRIHTNLDERGHLSELWRADDVPIKAQQVIFSHSKAGVIRAWHRHSRTQQSDYMVCLSGAVKVVYYDDNQCCFYERVMLDLAESVLIPRGVWHGYKALRDSSMLYVVDRLYNKNNPDEDRLPPDYKFDGGIYEWT
jgi:dTDP-4-dehydrorhamnose 3,5-epimerase-like enzyme